METMRATRGLRRAPMSRGMTPPIETPASVTSRRSCASRNPSTAATKKDASVNGIADLRGAGLIERLFKLQRPAYFDAASRAKFLRGCRWCDCPPEYGPPTTVYNRFVRWAERGVWEQLFRALAARGRSTSTQMIDSTHIKAHRSASGAKRGNRSRRSVAREAGETRKSTQSQMLRAVF